MGWCDSPSLCMRQPKGGDVFRKLVLVLGVTTAAAVLIASAGARTQPANVASPGVDMSTRAGVVHYLVSHGISPKGVVVQRGKHNYAGPVPGCLSVRWTCTTAKHVVQLTMG